MKKYEELKKVICEALPRLMDDVIGHNYEIEGDVHSVIHKPNPTSFVLIEKGFRCGDYYSKEDLEKLKRFGIEPVLSDVLEWYRETICIFYAEASTIIRSWDLSKPLLKDQSEELIDYLISIKSQS